MGRWSRTELSPMQAEIFIKLEKIAEKGDQLPLDSDFGRQFNPVIIGSTLASALLSMSNKGFIELEKFGNHRVVTISATGKRTGMPHADVIAEANKKPVTTTRDTCFRTGVRSDVCNCPRHRG
jgi:hypothetical protein